MHQSIRLVCGIIALLVPFDAVSEERLSVDQQISRCIQEKDSEKRLACFDAIPRTPVSENDADKTTVEQSSVGIVRGRDGSLLAAFGWFVLRETDSMTDHPRITLVNEGVMELGRTIGNGSPSLAIRCFQSRLEVFVSPKAYIGTRDTIRTRLRFGTADPLTQSWGASTSGSSVFAPNAAGLMANLIGVDRFLVEVSAYNSDVFRMRFDMKGLDIVAPEVGTCWRPKPPAPRQPSPQPPRLPQGQPRP